MVRETLEVNNKLTIVLNGFVNRILTVEIKCPHFEVLSNKKSVMFVSGISIVPKGDFKMLGSSTVDPNLTLFTDTGLNRLLKLKIGLRMGFTAIFSFPELN